MRPQVTEPELRAMMKVKRVRTALAVAALLLIGAGLSWMYAPLGLVGVGVLVWYDLKLDEVRKK